MKKLSWRNNLDLMIELSYLGLVFFVPLYLAVWFPTYNIFELNKLGLFKVGLFFLFGLTLIKIIFYYPFAPFARAGFRIPSLLRSYFLAPGIFIIILSLITLTAQDPTLSFFGSYARQEGLWSYWSYFLWLVLLVFNLVSLNNVFNLKTSRRDMTLAPRPERDFEAGAISRNWRRLVLAGVLSSALVSLYGILQFLGLDFLTWPEPPLLTHRSFSTFGQPNFLASWLLLCLPLAFYLFKSQRGILNRFWPLLILLVNLLCLYCTSSRGAWLALIVSAALFGFLSLAKKLKLTTFKRFVLSAGLVIISALFLFGLDKVSNGRLSQAAEFRAGSVAARLDFWSASLPAIGARPLFGYGLDNYADVYVHAYQPAWAAYGNVNAYTDRAHNFILDILLGGGLVGLLAWLILFYYLIRLFKANSRFPAISLINKCLVFSLVAYFLSLFFSFSFVAGNIYFFLILALSIVLNLAVRLEVTENNLTLLEPWPSLSRFAAKISNNFKKYRSSVARLLPGGKRKTPALAINYLALKNWRDKRLEINILLTAASVLLIGWGIIGQVRILIADHYFNALYYNLGERRYFTAFVLYDYIIDSGPSANNKIYYSRFLAGKIGDFWPEMTELSARKYALLKLIQIRPLLSAASYENFITVAKIDSILRAYPSAQDNWARAQAVGPNLPLTYFEGARLYLNQGDLDRAEKNYQLALSKLPDFSNPYLDKEHAQVALRFRYLIERDLGDLYFRRQDYVAAAAYFEKAYLSNPADYTLYKKIADTYYARQDYQAAIYYNELGFRRNPRDFAWPLALSLVYRAQGDTVKSLSSLNQAILLAPDNQDLEKLRQEYLKK